MRLKRNKFGLDDSANSMMREDPEKSRCGQFTPDLSGQFDCFSPSIAKVLGHCSGWGNRSTKSNFIINVKLKNYR